MFLNDLPQIDVTDKTVVLAPGEGKVPQSILLHDDWDRKTNPMLDPSAKNLLNCEREVKLRNQAFFEQRLYNRNRVFANTASFCFAACLYVEYKQISNNINICFQHGKKTQGADGNIMYSLDDPYRVLSNISDTPPFYKLKKDELIARVMNVGPFTWFYTLSCGDARFPENFTSLLKDHVITYTVEDCEEQIKIDGISLEEFLQQNQSKHEFLRKNILNATRIFDHRLKAFIKRVIMNPMGEMAAKYYSYRIEFQLR